MRKSIRPTHCYCGTPYFIAQQTKNPLTTFGHELFVIDTDSAKVIIQSQASGGRSLSDNQSGFEYSSVAIGLIEHLEAVRRSYAEDTDGLADGLGKITIETVEAATAEHREVMGDTDYGSKLRQSFTEVFLPRYIELATVQNQLERKGFNAWRSGDPFSRVIALAVGLVMAMGFIRLVHNPLALAALPLAIVPFFAPEIRAWLYRRRYLKLLQQVVDDISRIETQQGRYLALDDTNNDDEQ